MPTGRPFPSLTHLLAPSAATRPRDKLGGTRRGPSLQARLLGLSGSIVVFPVILLGLIPVFGFGCPSLPCFGMLPCLGARHCHASGCDVPNLDTFVAIFAAASAPAAGLAALDLQVACLAHKSHVLSECGWSRLT